MVSKEIRIPFHLCDPIKIMFFGSFFEIYHMFLEENISKLGVEWSDWFMSEIGAPIRGLTTQYDSPLFFGETYIATLMVKKIGQTTITFNFQIGTKNKACTSALITHCFTNKKTKNKEPVPKQIKQALSKHLGTASS